MRTYLTHHEATLLIVAGASVIDIDKEIKKNELTQEEIDGLDGFISAYHKMKTAIFNRIDDRGKRRLRSRIANYDPMLVPTDPKGRFYFSKDDWYDVAAFLIEKHCINCKGKKRCKLRDILWKYDVPECVIPDGDRVLCEYQWISGVEAVSGISKDFERGE